MYNIYIYILALNSKIKLFTFSCLKLPLWTIKSYSYATKETAETVNLKNLKKQ